MLSDLLTALCSDFGGEPTALLEDVERGSQSLYVLPEGIGIIHGHDSGDMFVPHIAVLKKHWGKEAKEAAITTLDFIKKERDISGFIAYVPFEDKRAISFAKRVGFAPITLTDVPSYGECLLLERV